MHAGARQIADDEAQRMARAHLVVAKGRDQHGWRAMDAPADKFQQIERRLVRPVHVFEDNERWRTGALELLQRREKDCLTARCLIERGPQWPGGLTRNIVQRRQWPRR